ncbi:MAG: hypothetical protein LUQ38_07610 [Methanotrichaceae archaeon]|nr:hypothetical protein [Methanotrichaceae archaeon]
MDLCQICLGYGQESGRSRGRPKYTPEELDEMRHPKFMNEIEAIVKKARQEMKDRSSESGLHNGPEVQVLEPADG